MTDLEKLVIEWTEARDGFCAVPNVSPLERFPREIWDRLANAEDALFQHGRKLCQDKVGKK